MKTMTATKKSTSKFSTLRGVEWTNVLRADLAAAMAKAGVTAEYKLLYTYLERTWGDRMGYIVECADDATGERIAKWIGAWVEKHLRPHSSYDMQVCGSYRGIATDSATKMERDAAGEWQIRTIVTTGHSVSTAYFPCAE